jgi:hypothetical protein
MRHKAIHSTHHEMVSKVFFKPTKREMEEADITLCTQHPNFLALLPIPR